MNQETQEEQKQLVPETKSLGDRMKEYEFSCRTYINNTQPAIIRVDGHCFSKFTKGLKKPYDPWVHKIMVRVTAQLVNDFNAILGYTQSDEITIVLLPHVIDGIYQPYIFAGQVQKIVSLAASNATNIFTNELRSMIMTGEIMLSDYPENIQKKLIYPRSYFDARIFNVPSTTECFNNVFWRATYDCIRNSINSLAHLHFSAKAIEGLSSKELKDKLLVEKQIKWDDMDPEYKYGTFIKKKIVKKMIEIQNKNNELDKKPQEEILRKKYFAFALNLKTYDVKYENYLLGKYVDDESEINQNLLAKYEIQEIH